MRTTDGVLPVKLTIRRPAMRPGPPTAAPTGHDVATPGGKQPRQQLHNYDRRVRGAGFHATVLPIANRGDVRPCSRSGSVGRDAGAADRLARATAPTRPPGARGVDCTAWAQSGTEPSARRAYGEALRADRHLHRAVFGIDRGARLGRHGGQIVGCGDQVGRFDNSAERCSAWSATRIEGGAGAGGGAVLVLAILGCLATLLGAGFTVVRDGRAVHPAPPNRQTEAIS